MKLIEQIRRVWSSKYGVTPWTNQELSIELNQDFNTTQFQIISDCEPSLIKISISLKKHSKIRFGELPESDLYCVRSDIENSSIYIDLITITSEDIKSIKIKKGERNFNIHHLVFLSLDQTANQWVVQYNTMEIEKNLSKELDRIGQFSNDRTKTDLFKFINSLLERNFRAAVTIFERSDLLLPLKSELQWFAERYGHQLNAHGLKKTFKFWSDTEKSNYLKNSAEMISCLTEISPHVCLGFGGVLGLYRDQNLIPHDDDIDILIAFDKSSVSTLGAALSIVENKLSAHDFKVMGHFFSHLWVKASGGKMIDVFVGLAEEDELLSFYPSPRHSLLVNDVFPAQPQELCGVSLPFPRDCLSYLTKTYGKDWDKPDINFHHSWNRAEFQTISGKRDRPIMHTRGETARKARELQQHSLTTE